MRGSRVDSVQHLADTENTVPVSLQRDEMRPKVGTDAGGSHPLAPVLEVSGGHVQASSIPRRVISALPFSYQRVSVPDAEPGTSLNLALSRQTGNKPKNTFGRWNAALSRGELSNAVHLAHSDFVKQVWPIVREHESKLTAMSRNGLPTRLCTVGSSSRAPGPCS